MKILIIMLGFMFAANISFAQRDDIKKQISEKIETMMKQKIVDTLGFDEATANQFISTYKEDKKKIKTLIKTKKALMQEIENNPDAADIDAKLDRMLQLESEIVDQKKSFFTQLKTFLTPQQIAKTIVLRKNFDREFKKEISKFKDDNKRKKEK